MRARARSTARLAALALAVSTAACDRSAEASPAALAFTTATPRRVVLDRFPEILTWSQVRVDRQMVPGQSRCVLTVSASDTADAAAIRDAFMPIARAAETTTCPAVVTVRRVPFTRAEVDAARARIDSLLAPHETGAMTLQSGDDATLIVEVKNFAAVERARTALAAATGLPAGLLGPIRPRLWMRAADDPRRPPPETYAAVLASHFRRVPAGTRVGVLRSTLPRGFGPRHLQGMPIELVDQPAGAGYVVSFGEVGQLEDGVFTLEVVAGPGGNANPSRPVGVDCVNAECFLVDVLPPAREAAP